MATATTYLDFDVALTRRDDVLDVRVLGSPAGETSSVLSAWPELTSSWLPVTGTDGSRRLTPLSPLTADLPPTGPESTGPGSAAPASAELDDARTGTSLFNALMTGAVLERYRESVSRATGASSSLRLMLRFDGGADVLPWELLRDPQTETFVALDPRTPVVRCTETAAHEPGAGADERLRILVAVSSPLATAPIDGASERSALTTALSALTTGSAVVVDVIENASLESIRVALHDVETHVFHYIGHGTIGDDGRTALALTDAGGALSLRSIDDVAAVLATSPTLRLVVLNSCDGSPADATDPFAGAGTTLVRAGIPAVVAMRKAVTDRAAVVFAAHLYEGLAQSAPVEAAVTLARAALAASDGGTAGEWPIVALHLSSSLAPALRAGLLPRLDEDVEFTVARPPALRVTRWEPLLVLAHHGSTFLAADGSTVDQAAQAQQRVAGFFGADPVTSTTEASTLALPQGAQLVVVPELPTHVECEPRLAELVWRGELAEAKFQLRAGSAALGSTVQGWLRVFCGPVVIAETRLELPVVADAQAAAVGAGQGAAAAAAATAAAPATQEPVRRYRKIFPCFAADDAGVVDGVAAVAEALGDDYVDRVVAAQRSDAPTGWLLPLIAEADVFQLFWSSRSMVSPACRAQWEQALALSRDRFVLPLYWETPFPRSDGLPPPALESLEFVRLPPAVAAVSTPISTPPPAEPEPDPQSPAPQMPTGPPTSWGQTPPSGPSAPPSPPAPSDPASPPSPYGTGSAGSTPGRRGADSAGSTPGRLAAAGLASAVLAVGFIAIGWTPGTAIGADGNPLDLIGLALLAVAGVLGVAAVAGWVRRR